MTLEIYQLPHEGIRSLIPYQPGKSIEALQKEHFFKQVIKLGSNENPIGCSPKALEALTQMPSSLVSSYPLAKHHPLMDQLAQHLKINPDQLFLSNGSDAIYTLLMYCFALNRDKEILTHKYAFSTYAIQAKTLGIPVCIVPIQADWQVDVVQIIRQTKPQTSLIFIANPNNPTGLLIPAEQIKYLLQNIPEHTFLVLDEAYYEFAAEAFGANTLEWLDQYPNLIITRTFSKIYGMAGLRLGYAIASPPIIDLLHRVQLPFSVNQAALAAGSAALEDQAFLALSLENNAQGMEQMKAGFQKLGLSYLPSTCNFLSFDCREKDGLGLYQYLLEKGIIIRPLHAYGMDQYLRVTIGTKKQNQQVLKALKSYYTKEGIHK